MLNPLFSEVPVEQQELASGGTCSSTSSLFKSLTSLINGLNSGSLSSLSGSSLSSLISSSGLSSQISSLVSKYPALSGLNSLL